MSVWVKIFVCIWLYLSLGFGTALVIQLVIHYFEKDESDLISEDFEWLVVLKLDPDDYDFGNNLFTSIIFWPLLIVFIIGCGINLFLKKIFRKLWEKLDEKSKED